MESNALTKSVNTVSTLSSPASTSIISELGFVYFLASTATRKVFSVCVRLSVPFHTVFPCLNSGRSHLAHANRQRHGASSTRRWLLRRAVWSASRGGRVRLGGFRRRCAGVRTGRVGGGRTRARSLLTFRHHRHPIFVPFCLAFSFTFSPHQKKKCHRGGGGKEIESVQEKKQTLKSAS